MNILNFSFGEGGWYPVEKQQTVSPEEIWEDQDKTIWPVFGKDLGSEKFLVRFPSDPTYHYLNPDELVVTAKEGEVTYQLQIFKKSDPLLLKRRLAELNSRSDILIVDQKGPAENSLDLHYFTDEQWISERLFVTDHSLYLFQTISKNPTPYDTHQKFAYSLDIEFKK